MVDMLKITAPITIKSKVQNIPTKLPTDAVFDIVSPKNINLEPPKAKVAEQETEKQSLSRQLNRQIFEPLLNSTKSQAEGVKKLVMMAKLFETSSGVLPEAFIEKIFVKPPEMMGELLNREKGETVFKGEFFDSLRILAKIEGQPKLKEAIVSILKHFDCFVNQENSIKAVIQQTQNLIAKVPKAEAEILQQQIEKLDAMFKMNKANQVETIDTLLKINNVNQTEVMDTILKSETMDTLLKLDKSNQPEIKAFLKNELIPNLGKIVKHHQGSNKIHSQVMAIVHHIVRYDKAEPQKLEAAVMELGEQIKPLTNLTDEDVIEMKKLIFEHAREERDLLERPEIDKKVMAKFGIDIEDADMSTLLSKALDNSSPNKIASVAHNILTNMVQSESPMIPIMHFMIPFKFNDENTYGEFFVDKDCRERKGDAKEAKNIFFTIQSDKYGNFEVDLLSKDKKIELDIKCPDIFLDAIKETRSQFREIIEQQGYRLSIYNVGIYQESQSIVQRFPKLALRKAGVDVKI